jgi:hypothetical protein
MGVSRWLAPILMGLRKLRKIFLEVHTMYKIISVNHTIRTMPNTKSSKGMEKKVIVVDIDRGFPYYTRLKVVFHHDMVFISEVDYTMWKTVHFESKGIRKEAHPFKYANMAYNWLGDEFSHMELLNMVLKMYRGQCLVAENNTIYIAE